MVTLASSSSETFSPSQVILSDADVVTKAEVVSSGNNLAALTVVGRITKGAATATKQSGTGDGTLSAVTLGASAQVGTYVLTCTATAGNGGTFSVFAPDGTRLNDLTVAVAYTSAHINLTVADGAADWGSGAIIHVVVAAGSGEIIKCVRTATDGSNVPVGILVNAVDATSADTDGTIYVGGDFNEDALVWDASFSTDALKRNAFDGTNIVVRPSTYSVG